MQHFVIHPVGYNHPQRNASTVRVIQVHDFVFPTEDGNNPESHYTAMCGAITNILAPPTQGGGARRVFEKTVERALVGARERVVYVCKRKKYVLDKREGYVSLKTAQKKAATAASKNNTKRSR